MLYDQAILAMAYIEHIRQRKKEFRETAKGIFTCIIWLAARPEAGFYLPRMLTRARREVLCLDRR